MHLSMTVAWFILAFLSLFRVAQQFSEVSSSSVSSTWYTEIEVYFYQTERLACILMYSCYNKDYELSQLKIQPTVSERQFSAKF